MRFLPSFAIAGFDLFSFLRNKKGVNPTFSGISALQTFKTFVGGLGDPKEYTEEEELLEAGRLLVTHLGEKEIISTASEVLPQNIAEEVISTPFVPNPSGSGKKVPSVIDVLEIPNTIFDFFSSK